MNDCHEGAISSMEFLPSQPLLLTSGSDNSLKVWAWDAEGGSARLLRQRSGHSAPPTSVRFYSPDGTELITVGRDRSVRALSLIQDDRAVELSQGAVESKSRKLGIKSQRLKLSPVVAMSSETIRARDWDNIVTCHASDSHAYTWSYERKALGKHRLPLPPGIKEDDKVCAKVRDRILTLHTTVL